MLATATIRPPLTLAIEAPFGLVKAVGLEAGEVGAAVGGMAMVGSRVGTGTEGGVTVVLLEVVLPVGKGMIAITVVLTGAESVGGATVVFPGVPAGSGVKARAALEAARAAPDKKKDVKCIVKAGSLADAVIPSSTFSF